MKQIACVCTHPAAERDRLGICTALACGCPDFTTPAGVHASDDDLELARAVGVAQNGGSS